MSYQIEQVRALAETDFRRLLGVKPATFDAMFAALKGREAARKKRGRPPDLSLEQQLLLTLQFWREYRTQYHLAIEWPVGAPSQITSSLPHPTRSRWRRNPVTATASKAHWRPVHYEPDLLSRVPWSEVDVSPLHDLVLTAQPDKNVAYHKGIENGVLADDPAARAEFLASGWDDDLDYAFAATHLPPAAPSATT